MPRSRRREADGPVVPRGGMSVGIVVALVAMVLVYKRQVHDQLPPSPIEASLAILAFEGSPEETEQAHEVLLEAGDAVVPKLLIALEDAETARPEELIRALARIGDDDVAPKIRPFLQHVDALVRGAAIEALASFGDVLVLPELRRLADQDPTLGVRQLAVIALADLGEDDVDRDLAAILDPTTPAELRESADASLEVTTDQEFAGERARAEAWLDENGAPAAATSVGGRGRAEGAPLVARDGDVEATVERTGAWLVCSVRGVVPPFHLALETATGRILIAFEAGADGAPGSMSAEAHDLPRAGRSMVRHEELVVEPSADANAVVVRLPRVGQLVAAGEPIEVKVIR